MHVVGLTGGIGSGKSTFARMLAARGAIVIDADALGHAALAPGEPAWHSVVDQFGDEVLAAGSMDIDRKRVAALVFADPDKLAALNAIVHPVILRSIADTLDTLRGTDSVVILDAALILEMGLADSMDTIIVVTSSRARRRERLMRDRKMTSDAVAARMATQARDEDLAARADIVVTNDGSLDDLEAKADAVWAQLQQSDR
ncbi:MAG TPA: dephospho-CoA kinase [Actinomycetota bacterium]|nr:dephospho-CoA kinase [Actinomycetota bacterium]